MKKYDNLDYEDIKHVAGEYSNYVIEFDYENSGQPVCIFEFYEWEYQEILKGVDE